jgi:MerR family transcriptional regulator, light-induced transcriptional regulator
MTRRQLADDLTARAPELAARIAEAQLAARPEFAARFGAIGRKRCIEDAEYHLRYLAEALRHAAPALFVAYVRWAREMLAARRIPWEDLRQNLELLRDEIGDDEASAIINAALAEPEAASSSFLDATPQAALARAYLAALLHADRRTAVDTIDAAVRAGLSIRELYLDVIQPVQREIGRLWQRNEISVAEEHYCTASTQALMARFYPQILGTPRVGRKIVVAGVGNELHEIGIRMVADFFELAGWDGLYIGANTPAKALADLVCRESPDAVALGVTMTYHLAAARDMIAALRDDPRCHDARIVVGGYVFQHDAQLWQSLGADGFAADADQAVAIVQQLMDAHG